MTDHELDADPAQSGQSAEGPLPLRLAVLLLWIEALAMLGLGVAETIGAVVRGVGDPAVAAWVIGGPFVAALALWQAGRLLVNRRLAGQGLGIAVQLTAIPVVMTMITGGGPLRVAGVLIGAFGVATAALLVAPSSRAALVR